MRFKVQNEWMNIWIKHEAEWKLKSLVVMNDGMKQTGLKCKRFIENKRAVTGDSWRKVYEINIYKVNNCDFWGKNNNDKRRFLREEKNKWTERNEQRRWKGPKNNRLRNKNSKSHKTHSCVPQKAFKIK